MNPCCVKVVALKWRISQPDFHFHWENFHFPRFGLFRLATLGKTTVQSQKMKDLLRKMKLQLSDSPLLSNYFRAAWNYYYLPNRNRACWWTWDHKILEVQSNLANIRTALANFDFTSPWKTKNNKIRILGYCSLAFEAVRDFLVKYSKTAQSNLRPHNPWTLQIYVQLASHILGTSFNHSIT